MKHHTNATVSFYDYSLFRTACDAYFAGGENSNIENNWIGEVGKNLVYEISGLVSCLPFRDMVPFREADYAFFIGCVVMVRFYL